MKYPQEGAKQQARECCWRWLANRAYSETELTGRLERKDFSAEVIYDVLEELRAQGYLDDWRLAREEIQKVQRRRYGYYWAVARLRQRGIGREIIEKIMADTWDAAVEMEAALLIAEELQESREWERIARLLQNRGFSGAVISRVRALLDRG